MKKIRRGWNIPKEYPIAGFTITSCFHEDLFDETGSLADYSWGDNEIRVQPPSDGYGARDNINQAWCHEVIHSWSDKLDYSKMFANEKLTNDFGNALHELLKEMGVF